MCGKTLYLPSYLGGMLFREGPVDRPEELFDREEEFKELGMR